MKLKKSILILSAIICLSGCVSQVEYDTLNSQLSAIQSEALSYENIISEKDIVIEGLEGDIATLKKENEELSNTITELTIIVDELENGASRLLSDINNAFENKDYQTVIDKAEELHNKFNGSDEDIKAQDVVLKAQAEIERIEAEKKAEEDRIAAESAKLEQERVQDIIRLGGAVVEEINSVGGVSFYIYWRNESEKDIKYLTFSVTPYNAVGDIVSSSIGNKTTANCRITGPLPQSSTLIKERNLDHHFFYNSPVDTWELVIYYNGVFDYSYIHYINSANAPLYNVTLSETDMYNAFQGSYFDCIWYNNTVKTIKINSIEIEYMDGTKEILDEKEVEYAMYK